MNIKITITTIAFALINFFIGCADKSIANINYKNKNYEKAYEEYYKFANKGFPDSAYKIAKLIYMNKINKPASLERKYALISYKNNYENSALYIADSYVREKKYKTALQWYQKISYNYYKEKDFKNYLTCIKNLKNFISQKNYLNKLNNYAKNSNNPKLLTYLGKFYLQSSPFYNPNNGKKYLQNAYNLKYYPAGIALGIYLIKSNNNKEKGYQILKSLIYKDSKAAYYIGNYLYDEMIQNEKLMNSKCITSTFQNSKQFFIKKLSIYKYNDLFTRSNIVQAYKISYNLGNKKALYQLIRLDIEDNTFKLQTHTYSGFDINKSINYLKSQNDIESKLILASIYKKYPSINLWSKAKKIYLWYSKINKYKAYWLLYQYEKQFENKINYSYLNYLTKMKYVPAIIEKAYQESIINKNIKKNKQILEYYINQNNLLAINYLGSLYSRNILSPKNKSFYFYKKACTLENKPFYIPSEDLKIANYYNTINQPIKYLTINYYYAQMENKQAQLNISEFYKTHCKYKKLLFWLKKLKEEEYEQGKNVYYSNILERYINGNYKEALNYFLNKNNLFAYITLGNIYSHGYYVDFEPQKAIKYYNKALQNNYYPAIYLLISVYKKININGQYNKKIISLYNKAIDKNLKNAKINLAKFYININKNKLALKILNNIANSKTNPKIRYLKYLITGKQIYINGKESNFGYLLLLKAKSEKNKNPKKALYYTFRAMLCNTPKTPKLAYLLMKRINNTDIIQNIYKQAKKAPLCSNLSYNKE